MQVAAISSIPWCIETSYSECGYHPRVIKTLAVIDTVCTFGVLYQLNDVKAGGATIFPKSGVSVLPEKVR